MRLLTRSAKITWGETYEIRDKELMPQINLSRNLLKNESIVFKSLAMLDNFDRTIQTFKVQLTHTDEGLKREAVKTIHMYLGVLNEQVVSKIAKEEDKITQFKCTKFLRFVTDQLEPLLKDYYDSVREEACQLLEFIVENFIAKSLQLDADQESLLQMLRTSIHIQFTEQIGDALREAAD